MLLRYASSLLVVLVVGGVCGAFAATGEWDGVQNDGSFNLAVSVVTQDALNDGTTR